MPYEDPQPIWTEDQWENYGPEGMGGIIDELAVMINERFNIIMPIYNGQNGVPNGTTDFGDETIQQRQNAGEPHLLDYDRQIKGDIIIPHKGNAFDPYDRGLARPHRMMDEINPHIFTQWNFTGSGGQADSAVYSDGYLDPRFMQLEGEDANHENTPVSMAPRWFFNSFEGREPTEQEETDEPFRHLWPTYEGWINENATGYKTGIETDIPDPETDGETNIHYYFTEGAMPIGDGLTQVKRYVDQLRFLKMSRFSSNFRYTTGSEQEPYVGEAQFVNGGGSSGYVGARRKRVSYDLRHLWVYGPDTAYRTTTIRFNYPDYALTGNGLDETITIHDRESVAQDISGLLSWAEMETLVKDRIQAYVDAAPWVEVDQSVTAIQLALKTVDTGSFSAQGRHVVAKNYQFNGTVTLVENAFKPISNPWVLDDVEGEEPFVEGEDYPAWEPIYFDYSYNVPPPSLSVAGSFADSNPSSEISSGWPYISARELQFPTEYRHILRNTDFRGNTWWEKTRIEIMPQGGERPYKTWLRSECPIENINGVDSVIQRDVCYMHEDDWHSVSDPLDIYPVQEQIDYVDGENPVFNYVNSERVVRGYNTHSHISMVNQVGDREGDRTTHVGYDVIREDQYKFSEEDNYIYFAGDEENPADLPIHLLAGEVETQNYIVADLGGAWRRPNPSYLEEQS
jgi:hypothetical protein